MRTRRTPPRRPSPSLHASARLPLCGAPTSAASCLCPPSLPGTADRGLWGNSAWQQGWERVWADGVCLGRAVEDSEVQVWRHGCAHVLLGVRRARCNRQSGVVGEQGWWWLVMGLRAGVRVRTRVNVLFSTTTASASVAVLQHPAFNAASLLCTLPLPALYRQIQPCLGAPQGMSVLGPQPGALHAHPTALHTRPWLSLLLSTFLWLVPAHPGLMVFLAGGPGASLVFRSLSLERCAPHVLHRAGFMNTS